MEPFEKQHKFALIILCSLGVISVVEAGKSTDPIFNFCRRISHASVLKNRRLFINGGIQTFADVATDGKLNETTASIGTNLALLGINFTSEFDAWKDVPIDAGYKMMSASITGYKTPPNLRFSALYSGFNNSTKLWAYGGTTAGYNTSFENYYLAPSSQYGLWSYDSSSNIWTAIDTSIDGLTVPSRGASAEVPDLGLGFYLGGQVDNGTAETLKSLSAPVGVGGMIIVDTVAGALWNMSNIPSTFSSNRQGAGMIFLPGLGSAGVLVVIGGISNNKFLSMKAVTIFDIATLDAHNPTEHSDTTNAWYNVNTTGDIPSARTDFCLVAASAQDGSSTNIYLYSGRGNNTLFDDVYVLSLPSFTWLRIFSGIMPRWGMTCHLYASRTMIQIGGGGPSGDNLTADCDWEPQGVGFLDLSLVGNSTGWSQNFKLNPGPYDVPVDVFKAIGGEGRGKATKTAPAGGWGTQTALARLLAVSTKSTSTATAVPGNTNSGKPMFAGTIAGIVVGSVAALILVVTVSVWFVRRRSRRQAAKHAATIPEMDHGYKRPKELEQNDPAKYEMTDETQVREKATDIVLEAPVQTTPRGSTERRVEL